MSIAFNHPLISEVNNMHLYISRAGYVWLDASWQHKGSTAAFTRIYFVTKGEALIHCNGAPYRLLPGNVYIVPAGTWFAYQCDDYLEKLYFQVNLLDSHRMDLPIVPSGCIVLRDQAELVKEVVDLFRQNDYQSALAIRTHLERIVLRLFQQNASEKIKFYSPLIEKTIAHIIEAPHLSLDAETLAREVFKSASALQKKFKKEVGISLRKFTLGQVLSAAETDLRSNDLTLQEISEKYGFCDQFYFSRVFTRQFKIPPSKYRKEHIY